MLGPDAGELELGLRAAGASGASVAVAVRVGERVGEKRDDLRPRARCALALDEAGGSVDVDEVGRDGDAVGLPGGR